MKRNRLRELLGEGKPTLGTHILTPWPGIIEIIGNTGAFDYIELSSEYSPVDFISELDNFARAIELFPNMSLMVKVEEQAKGFIATRAIDAGAHSILFTDCRSVEQVQECIRLVRPETPSKRGVHGAGMRRNVGYSLQGCGSPEWIEAMNNVVIGIMIEKKGAMEDLKKILSVEGIDMVQFGPTDYSITVGEPKGSFKVQEVEKRMIEMALQKGIVPRVEVVSLEQIEPYLQMGVQHFCVGWDVDVIRQWCEQQKESAAKILFGSSRIAELTQKERAVKTALIPHGVAELIKIVVDGRAEEVHQRSCENIPKKAKANLLFLNALIEEEPLKSHLTTNEIVLGGLTELDMNFFLRKDGVYKKGLKNPWEAKSGSYEEYFEKITLSSLKTDAETAENFDYPIYIDELSEWDEEKIIKRIREVFFDKIYGYEMWLKSVLKIKI